MNVLRHIYAFLTVLIVCMLPVSCDVHEFPDPDLEHDVVLVLSLDRDLPVYKTVEVETRASADPDDYDLRHTVQIYRADKKGKFDRTVFRRMTFTHDNVHLTSDSLKLSLPAGTYRFIVLADNVTDANEDCFYSTQQFEDIYLCGDHAGCNDRRDMFHGTADGDVLSGTETVIPVSLERPLAKYTFISTDFEEFRAKVLSMLAVREEIARREAGGEEGDAEHTDTRTINLDDFKVVFHYTGFMPSSYNLYTQKTADARTGVLFETRMSQIDDQNAELGFDYVFVNDNGGSVGVSIVAYDMDGKKMAESKPFEVPLMRSRHTIVKGKFLTTMSSGAIGIDPGFDGEFNVVIP